MSTLLGKKGRERKTHNFSVQISLFLSYTQRVPHRATTESKLRLTLLGCFFFGGECAQWPNACTAETQGGRALSTTKQWRKVKQNSLEILIRQLQSNPILGQGPLDLILQTKVPVLQIPISSTRNSVHVIHLSGVHFQIVVTLMCL